MSKIKELMAKANHSQNEVSRNLMKAVAHAERAQKLGQLVGKGAGNPSEELSYHMGQLKSYLSKAVDGNDLVGYNLGSMITVWAGQESTSPLAGEPGVYDPPAGQRLMPQSELTEGPVPGMPADGPYRMGPANPGIPTPQGMKSAGSNMTKAEVDELIRIREENAFLKGQMEGMNSIRKNTPMGDPKGAIFNAPGRESVSDDVASLLYKGVNLNGAGTDIVVAQNAAAKMITNMVNNSSVFGKSLLDPAFKGAAEKGSATMPRLR